MNLQQLEYLLAVDRYRHFAKAAEACFVTQATLSMMLKKLEEELGVVIFDRSKQPVKPTEAGSPVIAQARVVLAEITNLKQLVSAQKNEIAGEIRIGIIPTLAPYLLPLFLQSVLKKYPLLTVYINELTTEQIITQLKKEQLDMGILATPLKEEGIKETPLFDELFKVYVSKGEKELNKKYLLPADIDTKRLWLLEEGHCLRSQMLNLCELKKHETINSNLHYEAGSIESLLKLVEMNKGITIVPELSTIDFDARQKKQLRSFKTPVPAREISLVTYRHFNKQAIFKAILSSIMEGVKPFIHGKKETEKIAIQR